MKLLTQNPKYKLLIAILFVPLAAYAITINYRMGNFSAPEIFRQLAEKLGIRVTQVCRPSNARYGARSSLHKRCQAMDIGAETPPSKLKALRDAGLCWQFHPIGYYGATADHYHVTQCSTNASRTKAHATEHGRTYRTRKRPANANQGGWSNRDDQSFVPEYRGNGLRQRDWYRPDPDASH